MARLVAIDGPKAPRRPGAVKGRVKIGDELDAPLPPELAKAFGVG
ncbi:MAG: hypothetical protein ACT4P2_11955 [Pseudomonadota bacterium]